MCTWNAPKHVRLGAFLHIHVSPIVNDWAEEAIEQNPQLPLRQPRRNTLTSIFPFLLAKLGQYCIMTSSEYRRSCGSRMAGYHYTRIWGWRALPQDPASPSPTHLRFRFGSTARMSVSWGAGIESLRREYHSQALILKWGMLRSTGIGIVNPVMDRTIDWGGKVWFSLHRE